MGITVCDSNGGQSATTLFIEVLPGSVAFFDDFENGFDNQWTPTVNKGSSLVTSAAASLQGSQGMQVGVAGAGTRAFVTDIINSIDNYHAIFQLDTAGMFPANGDIHTVLRGLDASRDSLFEIQVDQPLALGPHRVRARLRGGNGVWSATSWVSVDRPVAIDMDWNAGPSLPFQVASLTLKIDGVELTALTATNSNKLTEVRLGINDVVDTQTQGIYRYDSYYASSVLLR